MLDQDACAIEKLRFST